MAEDAPGGLEVVRRFVNTVDLETGADELSPEWLAEAGLLDAADPGVDLAALREVREALRVVLLGHHVGEAPDEATAATLNAAAERAPLVVHVDGGAVTLVPAGTGTAAVVARLLAAVQVAAADGSWARLKACRLDSCQWAYWDASKNRSRSWCSMASCGNRAKASAYRARQREQQR